MAPRPTKTPAASKATPQEFRPIHEEIARLAYTLLQDRGCPEGSPEIDWFRVEEELDQQAGQEIQEGLIGSQKT